MTSEPIVSRQFIYYEKGESMPFLEIGGYVDSNLSLALRQADQAEALSDGSIRVTKTWIHGDYSNAFYPVK